VFHPDHPLFNFNIPSSNPGKGVSLPGSSTDRKPHPASLVGNFYRDNLF
jgi:hypothetical protein